jgi:hypothetical protein
MTRFQIKMSANQRRRLEELAQETGVSAADLVRLGACWVLQNRNVLVGGPHAVVRARDGTEERAA